MKTLVRRAGLALLAQFALLSVAAGVLAHAALENSDPAEGATIATPYVLVARFDEELAADRSSIVVRAADGTVVAEGAVAADDEFTMVAELPALPPGAYVAHWIAFTADDNGKTQGDINFIVVEATPSPSPTPAPTGTPTALPSGVVTPIPSPSTAPTPTTQPSPTTPPGDGGQPAGSELVVPLVLAGAVALALGWFLLRRRPG